MEFDVIFYILYRSIFAGRKIRSHILPQVGRAQTIFSPSYTTMGKWWGMERFEKDLRLL